VHKSERLYGLNGKKEARTILDARLRDSMNEIRPLATLTVRTFIDQYWRPYLDRREVKPSTRACYETGLRQLGCTDLAKPNAAKRSDARSRRPSLPQIGDLLLREVTPLHIEDIVCAKTETGASPKSVRNLLGLVHGVFALAVDNDLIPRSPVRQKHKPKIRTAKKPIWTKEQMRAILDTAPHEHRVSCSVAR
jgi:hypothetical protein